MPINPSPLCAGIDDATKCPCIGSIFVAGVLADAATITRWKELGVKDSKLITAKKRRKLAEIIKKTAKKYMIAQITPAMIDDKRSFNLNDWEMLTALKILKYLQQAAPEFDAYIDNWEVSEKLFKKRFRAMISHATKPLLVQHNILLNRKKLRTLNLIPEHYADENHVVVGAASILAKTASDAQYKTYKRKYGNFGSGSPGDPTTRRFVWQHRHNPLPIIRTTWKTFETLAKLERLEDDPVFNRKKKELIHEETNQEKMGKAC